VRSDLVEGEAGRAHAVEQADAGAEQHGREGNRELVDQAAVQVLLDRLGPALHTHRVNIRRATDDVRRASGP
jgi:hypothetical protein